MLLRQIAIVFISLGTVSGFAQSDSRRTDIDKYLQPYVQSNNFSGAVLISKDGKEVFRKAYGFANRKRRIQNTTETQFHIASVSMQFTAATVLRLVDAGLIKLDESVGTFLPGIQGADRITVRDLLMQRSGLPDINGLPEYDEVLQRHQTPASLISRILDKPLLLEPGTKYLHEEHSAYNLLALIVEKKTGLSFADAVQESVFRPIGLNHSGLDDDSIHPTTRMAEGNEPEGTYGLRPAKAIHWSAKTGNGSVYTTVSDAARWVDTLFSGSFLSPASRGLVLDTSTKVGYGWFRGQNKRFGETAYYMNGRAPGFSSFVLYMPGPKMTVAVLSNVYSSATTTIGYDLAALSLGQHYQSLHIRNIGPRALKRCIGTFRFGADFYQANATVSLVVLDEGLEMHWPSAETSILIPLGDDRFIDRSYWADVKIERDVSEKTVALIYDQFRGTPSR
ncbi:MAG TPA: serine hydrolase domain-containing protein [Candidatus Sulfotelmatobacter sp.]|nr:serine hydrolase domain-containing protein [Candidatus Sulfotelmatobacter sp.]